LVLLLPTTSHCSLLITTPPYEVVTVGPYYGNYKTLDAALNAVAEGGTIEVLYKPDPYLFPCIIVEKNVKIIGIPDSNGNLPTIYFTGLSSSAVEVKSPDFFHIENLVLSFQTNKTLIKSHAENMSLDNITTNYSIPIEILEPTSSKEINISVTNSYFSTKAPKVNISSSVSGNILFSNNKFTTTSLIIENTGANVSINNNIFTNSGIVNESDSTGIVTVENNLFEGTRSIINNSSSRNIHINKNRFISSDCYIYNNDSNQSLNLRNNWWKSINGPLGSDSFIEFKGDIDYSNWALNEECTSFFSGEPLPNEVYVDKNYSVKNSGTYIWEYQAFNNITDAINYVAPEGTVHIASGEYNEFLSVNKSVKLIGDSSNLPIISSPKDRAINVTSDSVELHNLKIDGKNLVSTALQADNINSIVINNVEISNVMSSAVSLKNVSGYVLVDSCNIHDSPSSTGLFINGNTPESIDIKNTLLTHLDKGIVLEEVYKENAMIVNIGDINNPNTFISNNYYIYLNNFNDGINAVNNNWDFENVEEKLYHYLDDPSLGEITYLPEGYITGKGLLKNSFCHSGIKVNLLYNDKIISSTYTDENGDFFFNNIRPNVYTLSFEYKNYEKKLIEIEMTTEGLEVNVQLSYKFRLFDVNNDGNLTDSDLYSTINNFGVTIEDTTWNGIYDFNRNERIDILDLIMILRMGDE
jgi:acetyltransferase-like isoleucine patch superfamily enzyme